MVADCCARVVAGFLQCDDLLEGFVGWFDDAGAARPFSLLLLLIFGLLCIQV